MYASADTIPEVRAAIDHVRTICPCVVGVIILPCGYWLFIESDGTAPGFPTNMNMQPLEAMLNAVGVEPCAYFLSREFWPESEE